jgi:hypothetical protein
MARQTMARKRENGARLKKRDFANATESSLGLARRKIMIIKPRRSSERHSLQWKFIFRSG